MTYFIDPRGKNTVWTVADVDDSITMGLHVQRSLILNMGFLDQRKNACSMSDINVFQ